MNIHIPEWRPWVRNLLPACPPSYELRYLTSEGVVLDRLPPAAEQVTHYCLLGPWMPWGHEAAVALLGIGGKPDPLIEYSEGEEVRADHLHRFLRGIHRAAELRWRFACPPAPSLKANPLTAPVLLDKAAGHMRDRAATYDQPEGERSMARTVAAFNAITGRDLKESEGWLLLQLLKDVRDRQRPAAHRDSLEDCIAYAALKAEARLAE